MRSERIFATIHTTGRAVEQKNSRTVEQMEANSSEKCENLTMIHTTGWRKRGLKCLHQDEIEGGRRHR